MLLEIESNWYLLDVFCQDCDDGQTYELTTDGHHYAQCAKCLKTYRCGCEKLEDQLLGCADGLLVCWNCGQEAHE